MKPKTPEEILSEKSGWIVENIKKPSAQFDLTITFHTAIEAMKAYADQLELSDEEIRCQILKDDPVNDLDDEWDYGFRQGKLIGAKWYREQLKRMRNEKYR